MPKSADREDRNSYHYHYSVDGYVFYVGKGSKGKGYTDRINGSIPWAMNNAGKKRLRLNMAVLAELMNRRKKIETWQSEPMTRAQALACEKEKIAKLARAGHFLTNKMHNPFPPSDDVDAAIQAILRGARTVGEEAR